MKVTELMINDWVAEAIQPSNKWQFKVEDFVNLDDNDCIPIELSEDILKANGWEVMGECIGMVRCLYRISASKRIRLYLHHPYILQYIDDDRNAEYEVREWTIGNIRLVHELQHALRLCGLHDLADNFKIKAKEERQ